MHKFFQTTKVEHDKPVQGNITGDIPDWVCGSLYRNGPGMYEVGEYKYEHFFDPLAMFQRFHIEDKKVTYQSRYLRSDAYKINTAANRIVVYGVGTLSVPDPCQNIFSRFLSRFKQGEKNDNTIVNFFPLEDEIYSATENNFIHKIDPETLETLDKVDISQYVAVNSATAHPHTDPDGTVHNIGHSYAGGPKICLIKIPPKTDKSEQFPKGEVISSIPSPTKSKVNYFHSFGMTENFYVYVEEPIFIDLVKVLTAKARGVPLNTAIQYKPKIKARFRIIHKRTGQEINPDFIYEADAFNTFHHINCYEEKGHVIVDIVCFKTGEQLDYIYLKNLTSEECEAGWRKCEEPEPRRYVIPLEVSHSTPMNENLVQTGSSIATAVRKDESRIFLSWETLAETGFEFPQINYGYNGKKYRYVYGTGWHTKGRNFHTVSKIDVENKTFVEWAEDNCYPSEPVFVANPNGKSEDDGVVLSAVNRSDYDESGKNAFLLVLDGKSMKEIARAEFNVQRFPKDFHGIFRQNRTEKTSF